MIVMSEISTAIERLDLLYIANIAKLVITPLNPSTLAYPDEP